MREEITPLSDGRKILQEVHEFMITCIYRVLVLTLLLPMFIIQMGGSVSQAIETGKAMTNLLVLMVLIALLGPYVLTLGAAALDKYDVIDYQRVIHV